MDAINNGDNCRIVSDEIASQFVNLIVRAPITNPRPIPPASPINMEAGGRLKIRKPHRAPKIVKDSKAILKSPIRKAMYPINIVLIAPRPALRPSILSKKLKALVKITTQRTVMEMSIAGIADTFKQKVGSLKISNTVIVN